MRNLLKALVVVGTLSAPMVSFAGAPAQDAPTEKAPVKAKTTKTKTKAKTTKTRTSKTTAKTKAKSDEKPAADKTGE